MVMIIKIKLKLGPYENVEKNKQTNFGFVTHHQHLINGTDKVIFGLLFRKEEG